MAEPPEERLAPLEEQAEVEAPEVQPEAPLAERLVAQPAGLSPAARAVEQQAAPVVEQQAAPVVEQQAAPAVEQQAAPAVEQQGARAAAPLVGAAAESGQACSISRTSMSARGSDKRSLLQ
jgi:hypothetical protein